MNSDQSVSQDIVMEPTEGYNNDTANNENVNNENVNNNDNSEILPEDTGAAAYIGAEESNYRWGRQQPREKTSNSTQPVNEQKTTVPTTIPPPSPQEQSTDAVTHHTQISTPATVAAQQHEGQTTAEHTAAGNHAMQNNSDILHIDNYKMTPEPVETERDVMKRYFPQSEEIYEFSETGDLLGLNDENLDCMERYNTKKVVNSHYYFFKNGEARNLSQAKTIVIKLTSIKSSLKFGKCMMNKIKKWLK